MAVSRSRKARYSRRRKRRMDRVEHDLTDEQWTALVTAWAGCAYCRVTGVPLQRDCVLPVSRGGRYTLDNVVPACRSCNTSKCNAEVTGWMRRKRLDERSFLVRHYEIATEVARQLMLEVPSPAQEIAPSCGLSTPVNENAIVTRHGEASTERRSVAIIGAAHRCGTAIGQALAANGYDLALLSLAKLSSRATKLAQLGVRAVALRLGTDIDAMVDELVASVGVPDVVVHIAVAEHATPWGGVDGWTRHILGRMRPGASVVAVAEQADAAVVESVVAELASLGAVMALIRADGMKPDDVARAVVTAARAAAGEASSTL